MGLSRDLVRTLERAEKRATKMQDNFVVTEHLLMALAEDKGAAGQVLKAAGVTPERIEEVYQELRGDDRVKTAEDKTQFRGAGAVRPQHLRPRARRQARPGHRPYRRDPPHHPGAFAPHQEQPRAHRRTRRGQDRHRGGHRPAHRGGRRAQHAEGPRPHRARHERARGGCQVPRRVRGPSEGRAEGSREVRRARSSCSSTSFTPSWARAPPRAPWTPATS